MCTKQPKLCKRKGSTRGRTEIKTCIMTERKGERKDPAMGVDEAEANVRAV